MKMKKLLALLLAGTMLLPQAAAFAEEVEEEPQASAIIVEAENAEVVEGAFKKVSGGTRSGGSAMQCYVTKETPSSISMNFNVEVEDEYDVWLLASSGSVLHLSTYEWMINDDTAWRPYSGLAGGSGYATTLSIAVSWMRMTRRIFTPGSYTFSIKTEKLRALASDFMFAEIDAVYIVPTSWGWQANGTMPPYDARQMDFEYVEGKLSHTTISPKNNLKVTVTNKLNKEQPFVAQLYTEIRYKGEKVTGAIHEMTTPANKWRKGKEYSNTVNLTIPFNAPDGDYEVWTGIYNINYGNGESMAKVGDLKVVGNEEVKEIIPNEVDINVLSMPETVERQVPFTVEAEYTPTTDKQGVKPYLQFYNPKNGNEMWYVAEGDTAVDMVTGVKEKDTFTFTVKDDVPDGEYNVRLAFHYYNNNDDFNKVTIAGGEYVRKKAHKPLSFGTLKATRTPNFQFWYVDQTHTLIWNGEPYIPMGGMYVSPYLLNYGSEDMWKHEMEILDRLVEKGVRHFYINSNRGVTSLPTWVLDGYYQELEKRGIQYGMQVGGNCYGDEFYEMRAIDSRIMGEGEGAQTVIVEAAGRAQGSTGSITDQSNLWVAINEETGEVLDSGVGKSEVINSSSIRHYADVKAPAGVKYKVYFNSWVKTTSKGAYINPFIAHEQFMNDYKKFYGNMETYDGLRNLIDPMINEWGFHNWNEPRRLTGPGSDERFAEWLKNEYGTVEKVNEAWAMLDIIESLDVAGRLIPVYTEDTDPVQYISYCVDRVTGKSYRTNARRGTLWDDYLKFRTWVTAEIHHEIADISSSLPNIDVPVMVKHISILEDHNVNHYTDRGIDGIGGEIYGSYDMATAKRTYPYSEVELAAKTQWFILTEGNTEESSPAKAASDTPVCYNTEEQMHGYFNEHLAQGMKGIYDFLLYWEGDPSIEVWDYDNRHECYDWNANYREFIEENLYEIAAYERNDGNPHTWVYPAGHAWWWMPNRRRAAVHDDDYISMRVPQWNGEPVMTGFDPFVDKERLIVTLENSPATNEWGPAYNEYLAQQPEDETVIHVGLRKDLGTLPIIDKYYTSETIADGEHTIQVLSPTPTSKVLLEKDGKPYALKDGNIYIIATTEWSHAHPSSDQWRCINAELFSKVGLEYNPVKPAAKKQDGDTKEIEVNFTDIDGHWAEANIVDLAKQGIIAGRSAEIFAPNDNITRAELLQLMFASINMQLYNYANCFSDVSANDWYANVMQTANESKILASHFINGRSILPEQPITREETASILSKMCIAAGKAGLADISAFADVSSVGGWAMQDMQNVVAQKIMLGDDNNCLNPASTLTRAEAAAMIARFMGVYLAK